jgi:hypothetical protein
MTIKPGCLVKKISGDLDFGMIGIVVEVIEDNPDGTQILCVSTELGTKNWYKEFVEKIAKT